MGRTALFPRAEVQPPPLARYHFLPDLPEAAGRRRYDPAVTEPALPALALDGLEAVVFDTDGRPRYDGVAGFLASRGIRLPLGDPSDPPDRETGLRATGASTST